MFAIYIRHLRATVHYIHIYDKVGLLFKEDIGDMLYRDVLIGEIVQAEDCILFKHVFPAQMPATLLNLKQKMFQTFSHSSCKALDLLVDLCSHPRLSS